MALSNRHACVSTALIVAILGLCTAASAVEFAGGDGTMGNPFQITNAKQLLDIGLNPQLLNKCFVLNNDIDFDSYYGSEGYIRQSVIAPYLFAPAFEGWLDGRGHVVRHLRITAEYGKIFGLFGQVGAKGTILSLGVEDSTIDGAADGVGLLAGSSSGTITGCTSTSPVSGSSNVGGLVGSNQGGWLYRCGAITDVDTIDSAGALVAESFEGTITACFARGKVKGINIGGFLSSSRDDVIDACYFQGSISGRNMAGFIWQAYGQSRLHDCYCATEILGVPYSCAFARTLFSSVEASGCFWDNTVFPDSRNMQSLPTSLKASITGLDTESLQNGQKLRDAGWDFEATWLACAGDYPRLWWEEAEDGR